jgi:hypothetical protein
MRLPVMNERLAAPKRERCTYNVFRRKQDPDLCCAVPEDRPVPGFILPAEWEFLAKIPDSAHVPQGFRDRGARAGVRFNGFYIFLAR